MGYIGKKPTPVPLTAGDVTDGIITTAKIADGTIATADIADGAVTSVKTTGVGGFTMSSVTATTSGTTIDFTSIPAGTKAIYINFHEVSLSGTDDLLVQIGDSGGIETTGYYSYGGRLYDSNAVTGSGGQTAGALLKTSVAGYGTSGTVSLYLVDATNYIWQMNFQGLNVASHSGDDTTQYYVINSTYKTLSAELDRVRIDTDGSNTFDDGKISILYT